jgi:hypothetical protein
VARRARSRLGEDRYRIFSNNCEHFSEWCLQGVSRSYQVERLLALPRRLARVCGDTIGGLFAAAHLTFGQPLRVLRALPPTAARNARPASPDCRPFSSQTRCLHAADVP